MVSVTLVRVIIMVAFVIIVMFVQILYLGDCLLELSNSTRALVVLNCFRGRATEIKPVFLLFGLRGFTDITTEKVRVFLLWEVHVIVSVRMRVFSWVPPVILVPRVASKVLALIPGSQLKIADASVLVEVAYGHSALVSLVIDRFSSQVVLFLLSESFKNMVRANLHNIDLLLEASLRVRLILAEVVLANLPCATSWDHLRLKTHER